VRLGVAGPAVWRELDAFRPDLIHLAGPAVLGVSGLRYARARRLPVIASYHTHLPSYAPRYRLASLEETLWRLLRRIHNACGATLCPSRATLDLLQVRGFQRLRLWSRGVDGTLFTPERRSATFRLACCAGETTPLLLYVGRLAREKRIEDLAPVLRALPGAALAIVGDGPERQALERAFAGLPVTFTGWLRGEELAAAYASADVFVFPSDSETFGNVVLEAMASGLPVVAPAAGGVLDSVVPDETGLLYAPGDRLALIAQTRRYVEDAALRRAHSAAGLESARRRTWQRQQTLLADHYRYLIATAATAP
jgi:glycosyltransferase involved in cell wall biosynthesis